jgi:3'-5' exoribonuclease
MMGMLRDCQASERFEGVFLVTEWREASFKNKPGTYIVLTCQDVSGSMGGKLWEVDSQKLLWLKEYDVFRMSGQVNEFRGILELAIESMNPIPESEVDLSLLLPASPYPAENLEKRLNELIQSVKEPYLNLLLNRVLLHSSLGEAYRRYPAARKIHQAYLRGLWEHSVKVAEIVSSLCMNYPEVNRDLAVTGALFHDIGKISEYEYTKGIDLTTEGRLLGHILMGIQILGREMDMVLGFPDELRTKLFHVLASHHGRYEWQSPKRPKLMEALLVHYGDVMEAELWQFKNAKEDHPDSEWSPYLPSMERYLYLK